jgi:hypothetical protein
MGTFLFNGFALAMLLQASTTLPGEDSTARLRARVADDSMDGRAWFELGRAFASMSAAHHRHADTAAADTAWARAVLDSADEAFARAARLLTGSRAADSARVLRVWARAERAFLAWELHGSDAAPGAWGADDAKLPPALEELGENLLRGCPRGGVLVTAGVVDGTAAGYIRFVLGLRPDLVVLPLDAWRGDTVIRNRIARELRFGRPATRGAGELPWLRLLVERRPLCVSMAFARPPEIRRGLRWETRPLLWVAGPRAKEDRVPPRDFVFAAARLALDEHDTWVGPVITLYRRAARETRALCEAFGVYKLREEVGCR